MSDNIVLQLASLGFDISYYQGVVDFQVAKQAGIAFAFIKSTAGSDYTDPKFADNWSGAGGAGILRGAYHWFTPFIDPTQQANHFLSVVPTMGEMPDIVDIEDTRSIPGDYPERIQTYLDHIEQARGGISPIIYTGDNYWNAYLVNNFGYARTFFARKYRLWIANYIRREGPLVPHPWQPNRWSFWQYTSSAYGPLYGTQSLEVDLNVSNGRLQVKKLPAARTSNE